MNGLDVGEADLRHLESLWDGPLGAAFSEFQPRAATEVALAAALVETGIGLHALGERVPSPGDLLIGDLCLARASRLLANHAPRDVQIAFAAAIERAAASSAEGGGPGPVRALLVAACGPRGAATVARDAGGEPCGDGAEPDRELIEGELRRRLQLDPEPVRAPMRRLVEAGGKRLRPQLVVLSSRLGAAHDPLRAAALAAAVELIHDATLVHDDLVDEAATRRGTPTAWAKEGASRAIEVGDYYFARATRIIAELGNDAATRTIAGALEVICLAQIDDVELRGHYPGDHASYLAVVKGKTAALISAACQAGAELGGAPDELAAGVARYGELLGIAFQMVDDLLDYSARSGKPIGTDIRQRTLSLPLIYATEDARSGAELRDLLAGDLDEEAVRRIQDMVSGSGALRRVGQEARDLARAAVEELDRFDMNGVRSLLAEIATQAVERVS